MLAAREGHGADVQVFDPSLASRFWGMGQIESELRDSLHRRQLVVYYQPEVNVGDGRVVGVEALIRWHHPQRGTLSPVEFLPVAEDSGLIVDIGEWVLAQALDDAAGWHRSVKERLPNVYVNLSVRQLGHPSLVDSVRRLLHQAGAPPGSLGLEITETMLLHDPEAVVPVLHDLRLLGVRVGIDDFGTGYASLDVLRRLPVDFVKIDRCFVERLSYSQQDAAIVRAIVGMAEGLGIEVVAEGVETLRQVTALREAGCRVVQGYYFSPPQPADATARLLQETRGR
jgi:EAL domain-containing protein (putative c-di-GMP-specific phosphodiesterase class I)